MPLTGPDVSRLMTKVVPAPSGCWEWTGARTSGHGHLYVDGVHWYAHRLAYEMFVGPIPEGHQVHHVCENRACINPAHLRAVTPAEHSAEHGLTGMSAVHASAERCARGHLFDGHNGRQRICRTCARRRNREYEARRGPRDRRGRRR